DVRPGSVHSALARALDDQLFAAWKRLGHAHYFGAAMRHDSAFARLEDTLQDQRQDRWARCQAALTLGDLFDARARQPLVQAMTGDHDEEVRRDACRALGLLGDRRAAKHLLGTLQGGEPHGSVRRAAIRALVLLECRDAIPELRA